MGVKETGPDGSWTDFQNLCDVVVRHAHDVEHRDYCPVIFGQLLHGPVQSFLELQKVHFPARIRLGCGLNKVRVILNVEVHIIQTVLLLSIALFEEIQGHVDRDGIDPRVECGLPLKADQRPVGLGKDVLKQVIGVLMIGRHVVDQPIKLGAVLPHQIIKSGGIPPSGALNQPFVFVNLAFDGHGGGFPPPDTESGGTEGGTYD